MNKIILSLALFLSIITAPVHAQEEGTKDPHDLFLDMISIRNPFQSKLPQKKQDQTKEDAAAEQDGKTKTGKPLITPPNNQNKIPVIAAPPAPVERFVLPELVISGIVWNTERPQAIINEQVVNINDTIAGVKIIAISQTGVDISFKGKTVTLKP